MDNFKCSYEQKKSSTEFPSHFELNGTNIVNKQTIADEFNNFFVNVGPNLAKNIPAVNSAASIYDYMGQLNLNSMFINQVNEDEVIGILKLCKSEESMDYDDICHCWLCYGFVDFSFDLDDRHLLIVHAS